MRVSSLVEIFLNYVIIVGNTLNFHLSYIVNSKTIIYLKTKNGGRDKGRDKGAGALLVSVINMGNVKYNTEQINNDEQEY